MGLSAHFGTIVEKGAIQADTSGVVLALYSLQTGIIDYLAKLAAGLRGCGAADLVCTK